MDDRMMTLLSFIADQIVDRQDLFEEEARIMEALLNSGCVLQEADAALTLMQSLVQKEADGLFGGFCTTPCMRIMNREERSRFSIDAFGFVLKLTNLGIISTNQREELLERAMATYPQRVGLEQIRILVALTLFFNPHGQETGGSTEGQSIKKMSWN